jgi:hypothetical protein
MFTDTVGVNGTADSVMQPKHFGSLYTMADYESKAHTIYMNMSFLPQPDWTFTGRVVFNMAEAAYDEVMMPVPSSEVTTSLSHQDFTFEEMHTYSALDYSYVQAGLGVEFRVSPGVTLTADADYADLTDDTGYVYGVESGSYFLIRSGVRFDF